MSETMFAKAFMTSMDRKPLKLSGDYVSDQRKYPAQSPYILPKPTHPFPRRERPDVATKARLVSVNLKPMKASSESMNLTEQPVDTTVLDLKNQYAAKSGLDVTKIRVLLNKRPCSDLKTLKDLLPDSTTAQIDFTLMIVGGASSTPSAPSTPAVSSPAVEIPDPTAKAAPLSASTDPAPLSEHAASNSESAAHAADTPKEMLKSDEFWSDLKAFLVQRLKNESEAERLTTLFTQAARQ